jgi:secreted trypsin-like serine protease
MLLKIARNVAVATFTLQTATARPAAEEVFARIIGGQRSNGQDFPFTVSILDKDDFIYCAGSVITPNMILTAAHCTRKMITGNTTVRAGSLVSF